MKRNFFRSFKNIKRVTEILNVFARYGFSKEIVESELSEFLDTEVAKGAASEPPSTRQEVVAKRLASAFEELGPTFIKLGQILAARSDLLPKVFCREFERLQYRIKPLKLSRLTRASSKLRFALKQFESVEETPIGSASIAQVHLAKLAGQGAVVLKIQKPGLRSVIDSDLEILDTISQILESKITYFRQLRPRLIFAELRQSLQLELDYKREAFMTAKASSFLKEHSALLAPEVYEDFCSEELICLEYIAGRKPSRKILGEEKASEMARVMLHGFLDMIFKTGYVHGDLHLGNLLYTSSSKLYALDFGMVLHLTREYRTIMQFLFWAISRDNFESASRILLELVEQSSWRNLSFLERDIRNILENLSFQSLRDRGLGVVLLDSLRLISYYELEIKPDIPILCKALIALETTIQELDPKFNLFEEIESYYKQNLNFETSFRWLKEDVPFFVQDMALALRDLPRALRMVVQNLASGGVKIEQKSPDLVAFQEAFQSSLKRLSLAIVLGASLIASAVLVLELGENFGFFGDMGIVILGSTVIFFVFRFLLR